MPLINFHRRVRQAIASAALLLAAGWPATRAGAAPVSAEQALETAYAWANLSPQAMHEAHGQLAGTVTAIEDTLGQTDFYAVDLKPAGYVVISADDTVEPIVAFSTTDTFQAVPGHPLYDMLRTDLPARIAQARALRAGRHPKWGALRAIASRPLVLAPLTANGNGGSSISNISDVRVAPLLKSKWDQLTAYNQPVYNYYTPPFSAGNVNNYYSGCVATMLAQIMRYYQWPQSPVGAASFQITVNHHNQNRALRGGDGNGGSYQWANMPLVATAGMPVEQQQAIGALVADAGVASNMDYESGGSGAYIQSTVLTQVFDYANAAWSQNALSSLDVAMQSNLDAGMPVGIGISGGGEGHAVVVDGYGYNGATLYHHLNMGWSGADNAWYNLPTVVAGGYDFNVVEGALFNIDPLVTGEVISGRIVDVSGNPVPGIPVNITAGSLVYTATTNAEGIYSQKGLASNTRWSITPAAGPRVYTPATLTTTTGRTSPDGGIGDVTGLNFSSTVLVGSVTVQIDSQAAAAGAAWRINGGAWQTSGAVAGGVPIGTGTLTFRGIGDWQAPAPMDAVIEESGTTSVTVNFLPKYALSAIPDNSSHGTVSQDPLPGDMGSYPYGASVTLTATPASGYYFAGWLQNGVPVSSSATYTSTVTSSRSLVANFPPDTLTGSNTQVYVTSNRTSDNLDILAGIDDTVGTPIILSVTQPANGTVAINSNGTLTFTPGSAFHGSTQFSYTIGDGQGGTITRTATITNWFAASAGNYAGLALATDVTNETSGYLKVTVSASGAFTGRLSVAGIAYPLIGVFDQNANYTRTIVRKNLSTLDVSLHLDAAADVSGTISDGVETSSVIADRLTYSAKNKAPQAGKYAALLAGNGSVPGNGYMMVTVAPGGSVTATGRLADGTPVSTGGWLNPDGSLPYYTGAYVTGSAAGSFFGVLTLQPEKSVQCSGTYAWFHPASTTYPTGFAQSGGVTGSTITQSTQGLITQSSAPNTITAQLSGPDIGTPVSETGELLSNGTVIWSAPGAEDLTLTVASTGKVTGSFIDPATGKRTPILGLWLPSQSSGGGYFIGNAPGALTLSQ
jgi:hypothetical protein